MKVLVLFSEWPITLATQLYGWRMAIVTNIGRRVTKISGNHLDLCPKLCPNKNYPCRPEPAEIPIGHPRVPLSPFLFKSCWWGHSCCLNVFLAFHLAEFVPLADREREGCEWRRKRGHFHFSISLLQWAVVVGPLKYLQHYAIYNLTHIRK